MFSAVSSGFPFIFPLHITCHIHLFPLWLHVVSAFMSGHLVPFFCPRTCLALSVYVHVYMQTRLQAAQVLIMRFGSMVVARVFVDNWACPFQNLRMFEGNGQNGLTYFTHDFLGFYLGGCAAFNSVRSIPSVCVCVCAIWSASKLKHANWKRLE